MGWGHCGTDSEGREIGYCIEAVCDYPGCENKIDRGLSYACGGMHGAIDGACEGYFCAEHMHFVCDNNKDLPQAQLCENCYKEWQEEQCENCDRCRLSEIMTTHSNGK